MIPESPVIQTQPTTEQILVTKAETVARFRVPKRLSWVILFGFFLSVSVFILLDFSKTKDQRIKAGNKTVTIRILPSEVHVNSEGSVQLWMNSSSQVAFCAVDIMFDPSLIQLRQNISLVTKKLQRIIQNTPYEEANKVGKASLVLGLEPSSISGAPTGAVHVATLLFKTTTSEKAQTYISIVPSTVSIIHPDTTWYMVTAINNSKAIINGGNKPTEMILPVISLSPMIWNKNEIAPTSPMMDSIQKPTSVPTNVPTSATKTHSQATPNMDTLQLQTITVK